MHRIYKILPILILLIILPFQLAYAETLEEQLNNLIGPKKQYNTMLSPVYLNSNYTEEYINPRSGELTLTQTDYVLPGRNNLDLEIKRIYKSGISNVQNMKVKYVHGAWVDFVEPSTSSFYENRYNLGIGMRFSFPMLEIKKNGDGSKHIFLHTESGDIYQMSKPLTKEGMNRYLIDGQTIEDVYIEESDVFSNGQDNGTSFYVMSGKDGKKTYFAKDGRILGIVDRYSNTITFEYTKQLISKITDTVGRVITIEYKADPNYTVKPISETNYSKEESWKESQNPNEEYSGDLESKFQVIVHLPGDKTIIYDKTAVLISDTQHVIRTRLQRVFDADGNPKYHYWYEQPDLGFSYTGGTKKSVFDSYRNQNEQSDLDTNDTKYSVYNRYENLVQIDSCKNNRIKQYTYNTYTKRLNTGSMQYRKIFNTKELIKKDYDTTQPEFLKRFVVDTKDKINYTYTNEADGFGEKGYEEYDNNYLENIYRYYTQQKDMKGNTINYTYDGLHQLINTEKKGTDHKEVITTEHDKMKLIKKKESTIYNIINGEETGTPIKEIENYRYDEYGNLTKYTGPIADRDENGEPINNEHTVTYTYDYDKFHILTSKTWKQDITTTCQIRYDVDDKGNIIRETKVDTGQGQDNITEYAYDTYGNMTKSIVLSSDNTYTTNYEYGVDIDGTDHKGAYLTKEYTTIDGHELASHYVYDFTTSNLIGNVDENGNRTNYAYDQLSRMIKKINPDNTTTEFQYIESFNNNRQIKYTDPEGVLHLFEYDILGNQVKYSVYDKENWKVIKQTEYDYAGNKIKEIDANGHSTVFEYTSDHKLTKKSYYESDTVRKESMTLAYTINADDATPLLVTMTDEEGYIKKFHYDILNRLIKLETTQNNTEFNTTLYSYDYLGQNIQTIDPRGNMTSYAYDGFGRLNKKTDALGNEIRYSYNGLDDILTIQEPGQKITQYIYDTIGRVKEEKIYNKLSSDYTYIKYTYDNAGNILKSQKGCISNGVDKPSAYNKFQYNTMHRVSDAYTKIDTEKTAHTTYTYDNRGNTIEIKEYTNTSEDSYIQKNYEYDYADRLTKESGSYIANDGIHGTYTTQYIMDDVGNINIKQEYNGIDYDTTTYKYDHRNRLIERIEPYTTEGAEKTTTYTYDKRGNKVTETTTVQGEPITITYQYDGMNNQIAVIDPLGNTTRYIYDENNNLIKDIDPRYYAESQETAPGFMREYDALNRIVKTKLFDGNKEEVIKYIEYDGRGNVTKEADGEGYNATNPLNSFGKTYTYDVLNRILTYESAQMNQDNFKNGTNHYTTQYSYDGSGRVLAETDAKGNQTTYAYNMSNSIKQKSYPDGTQELFNYDLTGKIKIFKTNRAGNSTTTYNTVFGAPYKIEYPDGTYETFEYTAKGDMKASYDRSGNVTYYEYDPSGNTTIQKTLYRSDENYDYYQLTQNTYNETNKLLSSETFDCKETKEGQVESRISAGDRVEYIYDKAGRNIKITGPNGRETSFQYDAKGNIITKKQKISNGNEDVHRFEYDTQSRLINEAILVETSDVDMNLLSGASFDNEYASRVKAITTFAYYKNGQLKSVTDANKYTTTYEYDLDKNVICTTDPANHTTTYTYDYNGNLIEEKNAKGISTYFEYDEMDRIITKKAPDTGTNFAVTRYIYDSMGNLIKEVSPNNIETMEGISYTYDNMNRKTSTALPSGDIIEVIQYGVNGKVSKVVDGLRYTGDISTSSGTIYTYDKLDRILTITDALGNTTSFEYDILGNLVKQIDAKGSETKYQYNGDSTLQKVIFADGGNVSYTYDKLGRVLTFTDQKGNSTTYTYNCFGKLKTEQDPDQNTMAYKYDLAGNLIQQTDKKGSIAYYDYDANKRLKQKKMPLEKDGSGNIVYVIEDYTYDEVGNLVKTSYTGTKDKETTRAISYTYYNNNLLSTETRPDGGHIKYHYDQNGNLIKKETLIENDIYDIEKYEYDNINRLTAYIQLIDEGDIYDLTNTERDSEYAGKIKSVTAYEYDILGNKIKETSTNGYAVSYAYDTLNRLKTITRKHNDQDVYIQYEYDAVGNRTKETDERGNITQYSFDIMNRIKTVTDARGNTLTNDYDLVGNKIRQTNALGNTLSYEYDKQNRVIKIIDPYNDVISQKTYDANGNQIEEKDAKGNITTYTYNLAGQIVTVIDPEARAENKNTIKYQYNQYGEKTKQTNALGEETIYEYDNAGRIITVIDALGISTTYSYDKMGNKLYMVDGRGKITSYTYGTFGKLKTVTNAENKTNTYKYDIAGNIVNIVDKKGNTTRYTYNNRNQMIKREVVETGDTITYTYDETGQRASMTDESGTSTYSYNPNNNLISITKNGQVEISYTYDKIGNIVTVTDRKNNITTYSYDKASRLETVKNSGNTTTYTYDKNGNRETITYQGGVKEQYSYDKNNRLVKLINRKPSGSVVSEYSYAYDLAGKQTTKTDSYGTTSYTYDEVGRIKKVEMPGKTTIYTYDKAGNRKSQYETYTSAQPTGYIDDNTGEDIQYIAKRSEYIYTATNQLVRIIEKMYDEENEEKLQKTTNYIYDENGNEIMQNTSYIHPHTVKMRQSTKGNLTGEAINQDIDTLIERQVNTYDGFNRLKQTERVKDGVRTTVTYTYNGDDLRTQKEVKKSNNGYKTEITNYHYDRQHVILETDGVDNIKTSYVRGINYILRKDSTNALTYYLYNGHGDVVQTVTKDGTVQNQYDYDIFGTPTLTIEKQEENIRYAGEFYDRETGLYYLRARYYNPYTGRFISEDSYWGEDTNPLSLNLYTYCHNDPINYIDPTGHENITIDGKTISIIGGIPGPATGDSKKDKGKNKLIVNHSGNKPGKKKKKKKNTYTYTIQANNTSNLSDKQYKETLEGIANLVDKGTISEDEADIAINTINNPDNNDAYIDDDGTVHLSKDHSYNKKNKKRKAILSIDKLYDNGIINQEQMQKSLNRVLTRPSDDTPVYEPEVSYQIAQENEEKTDKILEYDSLLKYDAKVEQLQRRLNKLGYVGKDGKQLTIDGQFGENTLYAVNNFKDTNELWNFGEYKGKVGDTTWGLLFSDDAIKAKVVGGRVLINGGGTLNTFDTLYINENLLTVYESVHLSPEEKAELTKQREFLYGINVEGTSKTVGPTLMEAAEMAEHVYFEYSVEEAKEDELLGGWMLDDVHQTGSLRIGIYKRSVNGTTEYALVNRGTQDWSWNADGDDNIKQLFGESEDMKKSIAYAKDFVDDYQNAQITFVGHSKGGAEAAANAVATGKNAILFNPATVNLDAYGLKSSEYTASMTTYIVKGDILNTAEWWFSKPIDNVVYLPNKYDVNTSIPALNIVNSISNHGMPAVKQAIKEYEKRY